MKLVLDTSVIVAAARSDAGASRQRLIAALEGRFEMLLSVPLALEYEAVLKRPQQRDDEMVLEAAISGNADLLGRGNPPISGDEMPLARPKGSKQAAVERVVRPKKAKTAVHGAAEQRNRGTGRNVS